MRIILVIAFYAIHMEYEAFHRTVQIHNLIRSSRFFCILFSNSSAHNLTLCIFNACMLNACIFSFSFSLMFNSLKMSEQGFLNFARSCTAGLGFSSVLSSCTFSTLRGPSFRLCFLFHIHSSANLNSRCCLSDSQTGVQSFSSSVSLIQ